MNVRFCGLLIGFALSLQSLVVSAGTVYVATNGTDAAGYGTKTQPYRTLQYAVSNSSSGGTVLVYPGNYDEGGGYSDDNAHSNRVMLTKPLTLKSLEGAGATHIVGKRDSAAEYGLGDLAMRCVWVSSGGRGSVIEGFTLRDGYGGPLDASGKAKLGGGACAQANAKDDVYLVDCVISNCVAHDVAALRGCTAVRCRFSDIHGISKYNFVAKESKLLFSQVTGNCSQNTGFALLNCTAVNCTIADNGNAGLGGSNTYCYNCLFSTNVNGTADSSVPAANLVNSVTASKPFVSPATGDWRINNIGGAAGVGLRSHVIGEAAKIELPSEIEMKDLAGNSIPETAAIDAGAILGAQTVAGGCVYFLPRTTVDGVYNERASYAYPLTWPKTVAIKPAAENLFRLRLTSNYGRFPCRYPNEDGVIHICYPHRYDVEGYNIPYVEETYDHEIWCESSATATGATGESEHPFRTLKAAMDYITAEGLSGNIMVRVRPGDYAEGTTTDDKLDRRLVIPNKSIYIKSTGGAGVTTIRGAGDANYSAKGYCGPDSIGCISFKAKGSDSEFVTKAVQGFTLADGHSHQNGGNRSYGGAVGGQKDYYQNCQILDCVFDNCESPSMPIRGAFCSRCQFKNCHGFWQLSYYCLFSSCHFARTCTPGTSGSGTPSGLLGVSCRTVQCTAPDITFYDSDSSAHYNGAFAAATAKSKELYWGSVFSLEAEAPYESCDKQNVTIADSGRLYGSRCSSFGGKYPDGESTDWTNWADLYQYVGTTGVDGIPISRGADGKLVPGCFGTFAQLGLLLIFR